MEDSYGGGKKAVEEEDLQEEEVWEMINAKEDNFNQHNLAWHVGPPPPRVSHHHHSAPVDIPGLSNIKKRPKRSNFDSQVNEDEDEDEDDDGDEEGEVAPPHEVLAKRLERTRIASHSMCEGVGRTLKGRDLSKTRNAILTKTGFIE